jgi:hypothetical protein
MLMPGRGSKVWFLQAGSNGWDSRVLIANGQRCGSRDVSHTIHAVV